MAAYQYRPPVPPGVFSILRRLAGERPPRILDLGTGRGEIARPLTSWASHVDAVDASLPMVEAGRVLPGGDHPRLDWIAAAAEDAPFEGPYDLEIAANSLHWMDWQRVLPRLADALAPDGWLVLVDVGTGTVPWEGELRDLIRTHSTNREFRPYDLVDELTARSLFALAGQEEPEPVGYEVPVAHYIEAMHSQNGFVRNAMGDDAAVFDAAVRQLTEPWAEGALLHLKAVSRVRWGKPKKGRGGARS